MMPRWLGRFLRALLILAPPLLIGILIFKNGVDYPVVDEWDGTAPLFEKMANGTLGIADFFAQHNEHRIFFPRLIFFVLGCLTHWNIRAELWVIWLLALICLFSIRQIARHALGSPHRLFRNAHPDLLPLGEASALPAKVGEKQPLSPSFPLGESHPAAAGAVRTGVQNFPNVFWVSFAASVLLFSPLAAADFLWGFQVGFLLPLACVTTCIWTAVSVRYPFNFVIAIILCTIATFSIASGFTSWLLITPLLLLAQPRSDSPAKRNSNGEAHLLSHSLPLRETQPAAARAVRAGLEERAVFKIWLAIWVSLFSLELLLYFWDYEKPPNHPPIWWFLVHPITAIEYILLFFAGPFSFGTNLPPTAVGLGTGTLLLLMLLIPSFYIWRQRSNRSLVEDTLPWLMLAMVTVSSAVLIMIGRVGFGPGQARTSRYVPFAAMLPIALVAMIPLVYTHWSGSASTRPRFVVKGLLAASFAVLIFCNCSGFVAGLPLWPMTRQLRNYGKALVSFVNVVPEADQLAKSVFPYPAKLKEVANALNRIGYLRPPLMQSNQIRSETQLGHSILGPVAADTNGDAAFGAFQFNQETSGSIAADGWAFLADERRPADAVLITIDSNAARGKPEICTIVQVGDPHQAARLRGVWDSSALPSTWNCRFPKPRLPQGKQYYLEAWAFNIKTLQAHRLSGNPLLLR
jgi:hypothetical protein